jgi:hypothetical protein
VRSWPSGSDLCLDDLDGQVFLFVGQPKSPQHPENEKANDHQLNRDR